MVKALVFGTKDCAFESHRGRQKSYIFLFLLSFIFFWAFLCGILGSHEFPDPRFEHDGKKIGIYLASKTESEGFFWGL